MLLGEMELGEAGAALVDEVEEEAEGLVEVGAVAGVVGGEVYVFEVAEGFEGVAREVFAGFHGGVA